MYRSLRKGRSSIYLQHELTGHSVGAELFESQVGDGIATLKLALRPVDDNQRIDQRMLHEEPLVSATIDDGTVIKKFESHLATYDEEVQSWRLIVLSNGKELSFLVTPSLKQQGDYSAVEFAVLTPSS